MQTAYWVAIGIFLLGIIVFFYFSTRKNYRDQSAALNYDKLKRGTSKPIEHYKEIRDKVSLRDIKKYEYDDQESSFNIMPIISGIVTLVLIIYIGTTVLGVMNEQMKTLSFDSNTTNASQSIIDSSSTLLNFVPYIFVLGILGVLLGIIFNSYRSLRDGGLL